MDVNSRDPSQNIIPFRIKGVDVARFDSAGNLGIGTTTPTTKLDVAGAVQIVGSLNIINTNTDSNQSGITLNGVAFQSNTNSAVVVNIDSQPAPASALNRQKKQSIPLAVASTLSTSDVVAKMSGVSVGKSQTYGVGPSQMASYGNIVVAVGEGANSIAYSLTNPPTASSWVGVPNSTNTFTTKAWNIAYANGTWVAVGEGTNNIAYSTSTPPVASSWVGIPSETFNGVTVIPTHSVRNIAYGNGTWVVVGNSNGTGEPVLSYSQANPPTAESWVGILNTGIFPEFSSGITFGNGTWVLGGNGGGTNRIMYSTKTPPTADSWIGVPFNNTNDANINNIITNNAIRVIYANGVWLAAGYQPNTLCYSVENPPIAGSWMPITSGVLFGSWCHSIAYGNGTWVACGESNALLAYSTSRIPHSSSWVSMKGPTPSSSGEVINNITFNAATNTWYFMGDIGVDCMFYSTATPPVPATWVGIPRNASTFDTQSYGAVGITTNAFTSPINVARLDNKVTFPANRMLAVGGGSDVLARSALTPSPAISGSISYSDDDGVTWQMVPGGATNSMFSSAADIAANTSFGVGGSRGANAVAWNGEKWVAAGNGRTHSLAFSDDGGMTWSGVTGKSIFSVEARDVAWNGQMWVAVGRGAAFSTAYSYDGVTWMGPIDASGTPINVFSLDIAGPTAATSDISGGGNHVIWTGKMWVATGTRTLITGSSPAAYYTIAYSTDGKSWTGVSDSGAASTGFDIYAHGVAWNGRNYIATGRGTVNTLVYFTDVSGATTGAVTASWQGLGNSVFSVWGRGITWGAKRWMATGRGTNTVAYSTNGRNWQGCGANVFKPHRRFMALGDTPLYTTVQSGQPQRGVAFSYSDDGITWDAPVVNQAVEFSQPLGGTTDAIRSMVFTNNILLSNVMTDMSAQHTSLMFSADGGASWARVPGTSDTEANGGTGMTVANNGSYSLATNPARTRLLLGGGDTAIATSKVYFSNDGFNWRNSISSPNSTQMAWVFASLWIGGSYNRWLIGGSDANNNSNGRIMYSGDADAVTPWVAMSQATYTGTIISCFAANTDFSVILAGATSGNVIYQSINGGESWTTVSISGTPTGSVRSIAFSSSLSRWVAVGGGGGASNTIIYSTDATGTAWIANSAQAKTAATAIFKNGSEATRVIWDAVGGRFIVGGWNGASSIAALTNVAELNGTNNNPGYTMAYSADGINWTPVTVRSSDDTGNGTGSSTFGPFLTRCRDLMALDTAGDFTPVNTGYSVAWNSYANRFVATGNGTCPVVYSNDGGVTWTPANQQPPQQAIAVAGGVSTAASTTSASPLTYTIDGKTWFQGFGAKEIFGTGAVNAVEYGQTSTAISPINGRIWVAGGTHTSGTSCLAFSQNGIRWTAITNGTTMMTNVRTIVYAPADQITGSNNAAITATSGVGNGVWVAGGDTTNSLIFSYDGISWSEVPNSLTILSRCNAIAFGNGLFVAGGVASSSGSTAVDATANMFYSTDGIAWRPVGNTVSRISAGANISSIAYGRDENGRGLWVAGASASPSVSVLYSYNGIDWAAAAAINNISTSNMTSIAYGLSASTGRGLWIAGVNQSTADGNAFVFSSTGRDGWTAIPNTKTGLFDVSGGGPTSISYFNGVWYATGSSAGISTGRTLAYSYDGSGGWFGVYPTTNIYGTSLTTFSLTDMRCVATTNDYILPSGASAGSAGSSGTAAASFRPAGMTTVRSIGWTAGVGSAYLQHPTILVGSESGRTTTAISADGGRTWGSSTTSLARSAFRGGVCNDLFWNGSTWAAVGHDAVSGAKVSTSKDGVSWTQITGASIPINGMLNTIVWNGSVWMVGGDGSPTNDTNTASFAWSSNLTSWNAIANTDISLTVVKRIAWNGMYWVAVGQNSANTTTIMYSKNRNGLVWEDTFTAESGGTTKTSAITTVVNDVVWGGGRWVAVGRGNSVADGSGVSILYSVDAGADYAVSGRRWVGVAASAQLFPYGASSIAWNGKRFIATGPAAASCSTGNIIAWSADGISWTGYSTAKTVAPGQKWIAVGSGSRACIALSTDGRVWTDVAATSALFSDFNNANSTLVSTMKTGARAVGWNGSKLIVGGSRSATSTTPSSQEIATSSNGRTTIPVCAFIGSGNGLMGGGTTNTWDASLNGVSLNGAYTRVSSSVFITHMDVNIREASAPWANMWLNTYTDLSATQLFQVTPEIHTFSSALKWNGWSWVANFGMTTNNPVTREQYGSIWFCTDPLARVGWSVASNSTNPRILIGQGGYAALEWNGVAWLACGYDPNNNNLIYTTDKYGAIGWTAVSGIVSGPGSASFQPVCIASSSRFWVVGGSQGTTSALYFTSDRTGATGWRAIGGSVLPGIRISSVGYNGTAWVCCGGGGGGSGSPASSISWRVDTGVNEDIGTGWAAATISGTSGGIPPVLSNCSAITYNSGANSPIWVVVGDVTSNTGTQIAYTTTTNGSTEWKFSTGVLTNTTFGRLTGIAWTGYSWIATSAAGSGRILSTMNINNTSGWNTSPTQSIYSPTLCTNAVTYVNIPISLLTSGMHTSTGVGAGTGAMWRVGVGRAQGLLQGGGTDTTSVVVRSTNGSDATSWSQTYSRNFLIAVGGGAIRDASNGGGTNRMAYSYDGGLSWTTNNTSVLTNAASNSIGTIRTVKYGNGMWVAGGDAAGSSVSSNNCLAWSRDGVNWTGAGGTQIFGSAGSCYAVCCNDRGRWVAVGGSPLTTVGTYTNTSGSIYTMAWSDDGQNWTPILGSRALFSIVCQGVSYGADASGVGMWMAIGRGSAYTGCAYSYDAKTWFLSQTSGSLFGTTVNVLTERYAPVASASWNRVCMSSSGQYQTALVYGGNIWTSFDYGVTWTARTAPGNFNWTSVSLSSTGQYQAAAVVGGGLWFSSDYGVTWVLKTTLNTDWRVVALSSTGQYVTAVSSTSTIWVSSNYGDTFGSRSISTAWFSLGMSSTGQYQTAGVTGTANYISSDYGVTWTITTPTNQQWRGTSLSSTGQYQTSVVTGGNIWRSTNYGQTWASTAIIKLWTGISLSSTGQYQTACAENPSGVLYTSSDYGETWSDRTIAGATNYLGVSISSTGQYQTVVVNGSLIYISSNFGETWSAAASDSRSLSVTYGKDANGAGMWVATAGRRDRDISPNIANTMAYSYDGKLWRGITAAAGLSEQAWSVAYGKDGFGVGMWVAAGYDTTCGLKWSYDGVTWNASTGASGAAVWTGAAAGRRALCVYWNGSMWLASTSDTRNGEPRGTLIAANNASSVPGYFLYSYNGKNWLPVLAPNTYDATISTSAQASVYSVLPNPAILDFGSFYDDQSQRGTTIANTRAGKTIGAVMTGGLPIKNINTIVPYGKGLTTTGQVPFLLGGDSGLQEGSISETTQRFANYNIISSSNAYDSFIPGPTAQSTNNQWQYFDVNQDRTGVSLLSEWDTGGNPVIPNYAQWDNRINELTDYDYPFIQKVTATGTVNGAFGGSFTGPALVIHPSNLNSNNIGLGYKNITTDTINVNIDIKVSLLLPALNTGDGIEYYIQRQLVGNPRYRIYTNSIIPATSTAIHSCNDTIELQSGEFIYLIVNRRGTYGYDHTRVEFTVNIINTIYNNIDRQLYYTNPITSEIASATTSLSTSTDGGITWRPVPNSTNVMTKVNKILCDESTQQIVAVGTGNYSVATSTPAKAADADGWVGVFGSRMTDTRAGLFEKYGTGASWFGGAKMWIASGRAQSRRGSSLAVSVNGTVWQDAKIMRQVTSGIAGAGRGGGLTSRTTTTLATQVVGLNSTDGIAGTGTVANLDVLPLYSFSTFRFHNANATGRLGPTLTACRTQYLASDSTATWTQDTTNKYLDMSGGDSGIQLWTVPATGSYMIRAVGAGGGGSEVTSFGRGRDIQLTTTLVKGEVIRILVGQRGTYGSPSVVSPAFYNSAGGGGTFVVRGTQTPIIVAGGGGGTGYAHASSSPNNASISTSGNNASVGGSGGTNGQGGVGAADGGGGGMFGNGSGNGSEGGLSFINGGLGGIGDPGSSVNGGFGGGGGGNGAEGGGGGGGYSGGGGGNYINGPGGGGGGGSFGITTLTDFGATNTGHGSVTITATFIMSTNTITSYILSTPGGVVPYTNLSITNSVVPYTSAATPLLTYTDSAAAFSTQVSAVAVNSQYNRAVVGGSSVQFVAGGSGGRLAYSDDGERWASSNNGPINPLPLLSTAPIFNGNHRITLGNKTAWNSILSNITVECWFRTIDTNNQGLYATLVSRWYGGSTTDSQFSLAMTNNDSNKISFSVITSTVGITARSPLSYNDTLWHHVAGTYSSTTKTVSLYIDGLLVASTTNASAGSLTNISRSLIIGSDDRFTGSASDRDFRGAISDVRIWNVARSAAEIASNYRYRLNGNESGLAGYWILDQPSATGYPGTITAFRDSTANANHSISHSFSTWTTIDVLYLLLFYPQTNATTRTGSGGFDASFGTVALTQRLTTPTAYVTGSYNGIALNETGQYQTAIINGGLIYTSSDYGMNWTSRIDSTNRNWNRLGMSSSGQYQTACVASGQLYTSSDFGVTWTSRATANGGNATNWEGVSISSSGQYQTVVVGGGLIWTSADYGVNWSSRSSSQLWNHVSISSTGQYQSAVTRGTSTASPSTSGIWISSDYGFNWSKHGNLVVANQIWVAISVSSSGQYQTALGENNYIYTSFDFGMTWTARTSFTANWCWAGLSVSSTGQYQTAVVFGTYIYISSDFGVTWTPRVTDTNRNWRCLSISGSGQYQSAGVDVIYTSSDFGVTWVRRSTATRTNEFTRIRSSASGQYQIATSGPVGNANGQFYVSSDYGQSWIPKNGLGTWLGGAVSGLGAVMMITARPTTTSILPTAFYVRTGTTNWRNYIPLLLANSTDGIQTWTVDTQWYTGTTSNEIKEQFSYFAAYWLSINRAVVGTAFSIEVFVLQSGILTSRGIFTFTATAVNSNGVLTAYKGALSSRPTDGEQILIVQQDGINAGVASRTTPLFRSIDNGSTFSVINGPTLVEPAYWKSIAVTNSAAVQTAVAYGGAIYRSSDYGASWSNAGITIDGSANANTITPRNWQDVAISAENGAVLVTCVSGGYVYVSNNFGVNWDSSAVNIDGVATQTTNRSWQAVAVSANGQYGLACVNNGYLYISSNNGASWTSTVNIDGVTPQATNRAWQDVGMSANGKYQVACVGPSGLIYYSKNYGANWTSLTAAGTRAWSSVVLSENGSTISATTNDSTGGVWVYSMPDDQYYQPSTLTNTGATNPATIRAIAYGNSGTGAAVDGYWVAGADASANSLAYSSNAIDWTAVVGSKTTLFNAVNGVAYGADGMGTPIWVAVGQPFVGSVPGATAYSIAYSYNMTTWVGVRNNANFTGQGNHVTYGEDEFGTGMWVAVGQADGSLAANLGDSSFYNSNGNTNTTIFYSYDGANWAAATGAGVFAVSGTDVTWGVDASGVATWVATGIGYTNPLTGALITGGQVAYSTNGRVWFPIRSPVSSGLSATTLPATTRGHAMLPPPPTAGFITPTYNNIWRLLGGDIDGEGTGDESGRSVSISADGTIVAIGANLNDGNGTSSGHVRVYKYNPNKTIADVLGPASWDKLGGDIDGEAANDESGGWLWNPNSIKLSADGTVIAIGANLNDGNGTDSGHVRVYKYTPSKTVAVTNQADASFGPVGWNRLGGDIDGEASNDYSGCSIDLSSDGTVIVIGAWANDGNGTNSGHARVYKYDPTKTSANGSGPVGWDRLGGDIDGEAIEDRSGQSVSISSDGTTVAIGAHLNDDNGADSGHVRVYKYTPSKTVAVTNQADASFGPIGWNRLGGDIDGEAANDQSGTTIRLSADGTIVAIGAVTNDGNGTNSGHVRVYKYTPSKTVAVTHQNDASFGPVGWNRLGGDIDGELANDNSGFSIALSADGTIVAIGASLNDGTNDTNRGHVRVYKYNVNKISASTNQNLPNFGPGGWDRIGVDIDGDRAGDQSGFSVALSADGTTIAIGAITGAGRGVSSGYVRVYKLDTFGAITYTSSNPAVAEIYGNAMLLIKDISAGTTTITATQSAVPPFTMEPAVVHGTLTVTASTTFSLQYTTISGVFTPFPGMVMGDVLNVAYGRAGTQGTGAPLWIVGGRGGTNVFARSSRPSDITTPTGVWTVHASNDVGIPFPICNSVAYSNGVWVVGNNTSATNILARSTDGGATWSAITASSVSSILTGAAAIGANSFCNFSLAVADYSNDTNIRSWNAIQGTKNFMFDGGVNSVATPTPNILASAYNGTSRAWWVAGGRSKFIPPPSTIYLTPPGNASIAYTIDPSGATGWTLGTSNTTFDNKGIMDLEQINAIKFSPHTQNWLAVGVGSAATPTRTALYSTNGISWTSAVVSSTDASLNLNTCAWNQLDVSASAAGRWIAGGTRNGIDSSAASLYISTDVSGDTWTPIVGTGAILSQVYSVAFNGSVWIAAGAPATNNGSTSTLMRTTDPSGASGWQGIAATNVSTGGFDTAARSVTWNAEQQIWIATGENTGTATDASFSSVIYSRDVTGAAGTWRSVRESNSFCFSGEGMGIAFKGDRWFASGQGTNQIVATTGSTAANASTATWTPIAHGSSMTTISDIAYTGRRLIATGLKSSTSNKGIIYTTDNSGNTWVSPTITNSTINALQFNGTTNFVDFGANITELGKASFTIECWVKTTGTGMGLLNCQDSDSTWESGEKSLYIDSAGRPVFVGFGNNFIYSSVSVNDNMWHHLAVTWSYSSGTSGTAAFYIDGINRTGTNYSLYAPYVANSNNTGTFVFGKPNYAETTSFFNGTLCELRIWNLARTASQISENYRRMLVGNENGLVAYYRFNQGIAGGSNTTITSVTNNRTTGGFTGTLSGNFTLTGTSSNWVSGISIIDSNEIFDSGTSIAFEPSIEGGAGYVVATGRSAINSLSLSTDGGVSWSSPSVQISALGASSSATTQPLFTTGGNSVAYIGNDTLFAGGASDVQWTGKRWVATGRNTGSVASSSTATTTVSSTLVLDVINNNTSAVATSDDGIMWQSVSSSQAPNISEGTVIASNSRIGPTPLINSQIVVSDGGDTEPNADYGGMSCGMGGSGTGVAQIDIIAELPPVSNAASSGAVNVLGAAGNGGANSIGNAPNASFDTTAFAITTRPI